ncbi:MAG: outer membrane beta-barrel protein [Bacteroidota bacterium]
MIKKHSCPGWRILFISFFITVFFGITVTAQETAGFNKREISIIHLRALEMLNGYENTINQIGKSVVNNPSLTKGLSDQFLELFVSRQVMLYNDLDPDHALSPFYESETYINNLLLWYPDGIEVNLNLDRALAGDIISHGRDVYSLDFKVNKQINGNYMNTKLNLNIENLLFRVAFNRSGNDLRNFRIVGIRSVGSSLMPDYRRSLEEVNSQELNESEAYTINAGIGSLVDDYKNYLLLLGSVDETEEDKAHYRESFKALFESADISVFNDLTPEPQRNLISIDEYLSILREKYPAGINNLSITLDSTLVENVINEENDIYSTYISLDKFFSGAYDNQDVFRKVFPLTMRVSFQRIGRAYENFRIRSIDLQAENLFEAGTTYAEPDQKITPVSRKGFSFTAFGSYGQTHIEDHNLMDLTMEADNHTWTFAPGYGINAGVGVMYSINDHLSIEAGGFFNQYNSSWSISGTFEDYDLSHDVNGDPFYKVMETDYDSTITMNLISIPLSFTYTSSKPGKVGLYVSAGALFSFPVSGKYESSGSWKYYGHYPDNPPVIEYIEIPQLGFYENDRIDGRGDIGGGNLNISARASLGITIPVGYFTQIRLGPEIEWGLSDFYKDSEEYSDIFGNTNTHRPTNLTRYGVRLGVVIKL